MKQNPMIQTCLAALLAAAPLASQATLFFSDDLSTSTINSLTPAAPTETNTSYQFISSKTWVPAPSIASGHLQFGIASSSSGAIETQARFGTNAVALVLPDDYIQLSITFVNATNILAANAGLGFGLYNSGGVQPIAGGLNGTATTGNTTAATGGAAGWRGYVSVIQYTGSASRLMDRLPQTGTDNNNQDLVTVGSASSSYRNPAAASLSGSQVNAPSTTLTSGTQYTAILKYTLTSDNTLLVESSLYIGADSTGTLISTNRAFTASPPNTAVFDAFAIGWRTQAANTGGTKMDINSIKVEGSVTVISTPPDILTQPASVTVPSGGSCAFSVAAQGFGMTYQWKRYGTNLVNGGNISGTTSPMLVISPASAADVASGANGYFVTITGTGGFITNSQTASLALGTAKDLVWSGSGNTWDLATSANWLAGLTPAVFNFGDSVTFNDSGVGNLAVTLTGNYLSAASVTVDTTSGYDYIFAANSTGSFAGPGNLIYKGAGFLTINNANTYSGGTIISNSSAYLVLNNYNGLGTGPVTLAKAGGTMEIVPTGGASVGIKGDVVVQDDFTIQFDGNGAFAGVLLGNLSGVAGKTLTLTPQNVATTNRYRVYGTSTTCDANLALNGNATAYALADGTVLAPYQASGSQFYNGVISGNGGLLQRGTGTTILSGQNTYTGGTYPGSGTIGFGADSTPTSGTVTSGPIGTGPLLITYEIGSAPSSGTVLAFGGARTIANALGYPSTTNTQTLIIGGTNALTFTGPFSLNGLVDGTTGVTNRTIQVNNTALTTMSGVISGVGNFLKTGNGTLDLTAAETYTGATTISAGTLRVNGSLAPASAVSVATNATLAGAGAINGPVILAAGGIIAPGNDAIGTLALSGGLTLSGNLSIDVNRAGLSSDLMPVTGTLTNAGTGKVTVSNLGATLVAGDTFTLFNKALANGQALTVTGAQAVWTNKLALNGTIEVVTPIATTPTNITYSVSGNSLTLSWPLSHLTWTLQSNSVSVASSSSWFPVPNTGNANQFVVTVDPAKNNVFYRLIAP